MSGQVSDLSFDFATKAAQELQSHGQRPSSRPGAKSKVQSMFAGVGAPPSMAGPKEPWEVSEKRLKDGAAALRLRGRELEDELPFLVYAQEQALQAVQPAIEASLKDLEERLATLGYQRLDPRDAAAALPGEDGATRSVVDTMNELMRRATVEFVQQVAIQPVPEELEHLRRDFNNLPEHRRPNLPTSHEDFEKAAIALEERLGGPEGLDERTGLPRDHELRTEFMRMNLLHSRLQVVDMYEGAAEGLDALSSGSQFGAGEFIEAIKSFPALAGLVKPYLPPSLRDTVEMLPGLASMLRQNGFGAAVKKGSQAAPNQQPAAAGV